MISIIIPTLNRVLPLSRTLASIFEGVPLSPDVEVLVVDNGSTDGTASLYEKIRREHPTVILRFVTDPMPGLLTGRHRGALEARGEILAFLDDDVLLSPTWLDGLREAFANPEVVLAGGPSSPEYAAPPPDWLDLFWHPIDQGRCCSSLSLIDLGPRAHFINARLVFGLNFAIRKETWRAMGGFHPDCIPKALQRYQGDGETGLSSKINDAGLKALYHPKIAVTHMIPAARLKPDYFMQRAYYQGVCDSYTEIRKSGLPAPPVYTWLDYAREGLFRTKRLFSATQVASPSHPIIDQAGASYQAGRRFHTDSVTADPDLLAWVTRPDYFDYRLPAGWEKLLPAAAASPKDTP